MTLHPGLTPRDSQILELLRGGAPVQRVIDIGRHRKSWNPVHVGVVVAYHLTTPTAHLDAPKPPKPVEPPKPPKPTPEEREAARREYQREWRAKHRAELALVPQPLPEWKPEPYTGWVTDVRLTGEQIELLDLLCKGYSNGRISNALRVPEDTVKSRVKKLLLLLGARDRGHAAIRVIRREVRILRKPGEGRAA